MNKTIRGTIRTRYEIREEEAEEKEKKSVNGFERRKRRRNKGGVHKHPTSAFTSATMSETSELADDLANSNELRPKACVRIKESIYYRRRRNMEHSMVSHG